MAVRTCFALFAPLGLLVAACADSKPIPGYENLGGADGSGGTNVTNGNGSTTGSSNTSSSTSSNNTSSTTSSSTTSSTTGSTTGSTTSTSSGQSCTDTGPGESNDTEATAYDLGSIGDADGDGDTLTGVLDGPTDPDWYKFHGNDGFSVVDPTRTVTAGNTVRVCKFLVCDSGTTEFSCPSGTSSATSPGGLAGCCGSQGFSIDDLNCTGTINDNAEVYVRIDTQANDCVDYSYAWHY